jgi:hypothetical protein
MRNDVHVRQLSTGHGAYLNVRDLIPHGISGFAVWSAVGSAETEPNEPVVCLALSPALGLSDPSIRRFSVLCFDMLSEFKRWRERFGMQYETLYLITPAGLEKLAPLPAETIPQPASGSSDE